MDRVELTVEEHENKLRLEDFLGARLRRISRMYLRELIRDEKCEVNGRIENRGHRLRPNDFIELEIDLGKEHSMLPQKLPLEILYEDADFVVVNKAAGMLVHPNHRDKNDTLLNALTYHFNAEPDAAFIRPGLIHRLDKETSGLIVVAKSMRTHRILARQFFKKTVEKKYVAVVLGSIDRNEGSIEFPIGRFADEKRWDVSEDGKPALTTYKVLERSTDRTLVELEPITGRTNQLRIHCAAIGHPIVGDVTRGGGSAGRLCLHARKISLRHPTTNEPMTFDTPVPPLFLSELSAVSKDG